MRGPPAWWGRSSKPVAHRPAGAVRGRRRHGARLGRGAESRAEAPKKARAIVGSGPAGLACAGELARNGVKVTVFEALHVAGGVLKYGIPEFRLPDVIIDSEIEGLKKIGVEIRLDNIIASCSPSRNCWGKRATIRPSWEPAPARPKFNGHSRRGLQRVFSANEFLTRVNLMRGYQQPIYDTPWGWGSAWQ